MAKRKKMMEPMRTQRLLRELRRERTRLRAVVADDATRIDRLHGEIALDQRIRVAALRRAERAERAEADLIQANAFMRARIDNMTITISCLARLYNGVNERAAKWIDWTTYKPSTIQDSVQGAAEEKPSLGKTMINEAFRQALDVMSKQADRPEPAATPWHAWTFGKDAEGKMVCPEHKEPGK